MISKRGSFSFAFGLGLSRGARGTGGQRSSRTLVNTSEPLRKFFETFSNDPFGNLFCATLGG